MADTRLPVGKPAPTPAKKKKKRFGWLSDWRFLLVYAGIIAGIAALGFLNPSISPIDKHMKSKGGGFAQITGMFSGGGGGGGSFGTAPEGSFKRIGGERGTQFAWVDAQHLESKSTLRAIGAAVCSEAKSESYCEVYFWTNEEDVAIKLPVKRGGTLAAFYENKNGKVSLKLLQQ